MRPLQELPPNSAGRTVRRQPETIDRTHVLVISLTNGEAESDLFALDIQI